MLSASNTPRFHDRLSFSHYQQFCDTLSLSSMAEYLGVPNAVLELARGSLTKGLHRAEDEFILERIQALSGRLKGPVRVLEIGAGNSFPPKSCDKFGSPYLSRYLGSQCGDLVDVTAIDWLNSTGQGKYFDYPSNSSIEKTKDSNDLRVVGISWNGSERIFYEEGIIEEDKFPILHMKMLEAIQQGGHLSGKPASQLGLSKEQLGYEPDGYLGSFSRAWFSCGHFSKKTYLLDDAMSTDDCSVVILPSIYPKMERDVYNINFQGGIASWKIPESLGTFDLVFSRFLPRKEAAEEYVVC